MIIWFNHWFSTAYYFIEQAKALGNYVIATNQRDTCVYKMNADEFYIEKEMKGEDYVNWAITFCKEHKVDIFFPKKHMKEISLNKKAFEDNGITVVVEDYEKLCLFESKKDTFTFFEGKDICNIPEMFIVNNLNDFMDKYNYLKEKYKKVCCKLDVDEGGQSFKIILDKDFDLNTLKYNQGFIIHEKTLFEILRDNPSFDDMVLMPYLEGTEYSIDCYNTKNGLIAVPRLKLSNRVTRLENNNELIEIAKRFQEKAHLSSAYNIQLRESNGQLYLLEVNTRLAGGSWKDQFVGVNFMSVIIGEKNGVELNINSLYNNFRTMNISNLEDAVILI